MTRERNVIGGIDVCEIKDADDGDFLVVMLDVDREELPLELDAAVMLAQLRAFDQDAYELVMRVAEGLLSRGAPLDALEG